MHPAFRIYEEATPELIAFLSATTLGTNGAKYQHLDTETRILQLEKPLHLSLIRNEKIIANITFSRRGKNWYVRYFAFDKVFQGKGHTVNVSSGSSILKKELRSFFQDKLDSGEVDCFYAYIDPENDKSHTAAKELGFVQSNQVYTQTFSRRIPKKSKRVKLLADKTEVKKLHIEYFSEESFFHKHKPYGKTYAIRNTEDEIVALANAHEFHWKIHRLPGRFGHSLTKAIPFIPILRSFIKPKRHGFIGVDHVWIKNNNSTLLEELFNSILHLENKKMILWWNNGQAEKFNRKIRWGVMHALLKNNPADVYTLSNQLQNNNIGHFSICEDFA